MCSYLHETRDILTCRKPEIYLAAAPTSISTPKNPHLPKSIKKAEQPVPMNRKCDRETRAWHTHASMANMSTFFSNSFSARSHLGYSPPISLVSPEILKPHPLHSVYPCCCSLFSFSNSFSHIFKFFILHSDCASPQHTGQTYLD